MAAVSNTSSSPPCREYRGHIAKRLWSFCRRTNTITSPTKPDFGPNRGTWAGSTSRLPERTLKRGRSRVQRAVAAARPCSEKRTNAEQGRTRCPAIRTKEHGLNKEMKVVPGSSRLFSEHIALTAFASSSSASEPTVAGSARCLSDEMHLSIATRSPRLQAHQRRNPVIAVVEELSRQSMSCAQSCSKGAY